MAQITLGKVVPDIQINDETDGKTISFTTATGSTQTKITNGVDGVSPIATLESTGDTLTVTIVDKEGTKTKTCAKGTTLHYKNSDPGASEVGTVWIAY